ncbi:MAG: FG-GAP-like repeat-containing protein, partial [Phycisphaerales bacterium]|nr:FG-GAP-like repeat-containing protein [Phycisphaerales bacterium]
MPEGMAMQLTYDAGDDLVGDTWDVSIDVVSLDGLLGFGDPNSLEFDGAVIAMEVVDLTGDGADEVCVLLDGAPGTLIVFQDDGFGGVELQAQFNTSNNPTCITSGDFNGDGHVDLVIGTVADGIEVLWNEDGDLSTGFIHEPYTTIGPVTCAASMQIDEGDPIDLMVGIDDLDGDGSGAIQWWFGWSPLRFPEGGLAGGGDQDTPGVPRIIDPSKEEDQKQLTFIVFNNGTGGNIGGSIALGDRSFAFDIQAVGADPINSARADLDDDGIEDIVVTSAANGTIVLLRGTTTGYMSGVPIPIGAEPGDVVLIDLNDDRQLDIAAISTDADGNRIIRVLQNEGGLQFTSLETGLAEAPLLLSTGDLDASGTSQLISIGDATSLTDEMSLISLHTITCPEDIDGNGTVNIDDLLAVISQFGNDCEAGEPCSGDIDGSDTIDIEDLLLVIASFGSCQG